MVGIGFGDSLDPEDPYSAAFDPRLLTVAKLRSLLLEHKVFVPSNERKPGLIQAYEDNIRANAEEWRAKRNRDLNIRPDARGITSMSGSPLDPPAGTSSLIPRKSAAAVTPARHAASSPVKRAQSPGDQTVFYHSEGDASLSEHWQPRSAMSRGSTPGSRRSVSWADSTHSEDDLGRSSGSEARRTDESEAEEEIGNTSNFSPLNPFQRIPSNFPVQNGIRGRKSEPAPRDTTDTKPTKTAPTKAARHSIGAPARKRNSLASRNSDANEAKAPSPPKRHTGPRRSRVVSRAPVEAEDYDDEKHFGALQLLSSLFWTALSAAAFAYYVYYVAESKTIGFCDVGRSTNNLLESRRFEKKLSLPASPSNAQKWTLTVPALPEALQSMCTACPAHAYCNDGKLVACESGDFVMRDPFLAQVPLLRSVLPLQWIAARCDPDEEKVVLAADLADEIDAQLRLWKGKVLSRQAQPKIIDGGSLKKEQQLDARFAIPQEELYTSLQAAVGHALQGRSDSYFQELWDMALEDLTRSHKASQLGDSLVTTQGAIVRGLYNRLALLIADLVVRFRKAFAAAIAFFVATLWLKRLITGSSSMKRQAKDLVEMALDKLQRAKQRGQTSGNAEDGYLSIAQLRDAVLRHESSAKQRKQLWARVSRQVEANTNVRTRQAKVQGEWQRVWEWVGPLLEDYPQQAMASVPQSRAASYSSNGWNVQPPADASPDASFASQHYHGPPQQNGFPFRSPAEHAYDANGGRKTSAVV